MKKTKQTSKPQERYYYNEHDENQVSQLYYRRKKKRRKLRLKRVGFVLAIALIIAFIVSPYSRVQSIKIKGLTYLDKEDILEIIDIHQNTHHFLVHSSAVQKRLNDSGVVKSAEVKRGFFSGLEIKVVESIPLAYQESEDNILLIGQTGKLYEISKEALSNMNVTTRLIGFNDREYLERFATQYIQVPESIRSLVSDISYEPVEPADKDLIRFDMNDGKKVYIHDLNNLASEMKYYQEILSTKPNACVYDIHGKNVYAADCE